MGSHMRGTALRHKFAFENTPFQHPKGQNNRLHAPANLSHCSGSYAPCEHPISRFPAHLRGPAVFLPITMSPESLAQRNLFQTSPLKMPCLPASFLPHCLLGSQILQCQPLLRHVFFHLRSDLTQGLADTLIEGVLPDAPRVRVRPNPDFYLHLRSITP